MFLVFTWESNNNVAYSIHLKDKTNKYILRMMSVCFSFIA